MLTSIKLHVYVDYTDKNKPQNISNEGRGTGAQVLDRPLLRYVIWSRVEKVLSYVSDIHTSCSAFKFGNSHTNPLLLRSAVSNVYLCLLLARTIPVSYLWFNPDKSVINTTTVRLFLYSNPELPVPPFYSGCFHLGTHHETVYCN